MMFLDQVVVDLPVGPWGNKNPPARDLPLPPAATTAVKRLNRYFCFLLLGFHLPVREKWAKMYKSVSQHNYLSIFLKILSFFR